MSMSVHLPEDKSGRDPIAIRELLQLNERGRLILTCADAIEAGSGTADRTRPRGHRDRVRAHLRDRDADRARTLPKGAALWAHA